MQHPTHIAQIAAELRRPFAPEEIKFRPSGGGTVAYVEAHTVMDRLDAVASSWSVSYREVSGGVEATITIHGVSRSDIGFNESNGEMGAKGSYSDALKRAAHSWGVGRILRVWKGPGRFSGQISGELASSLRQQYEEFCQRPDIADRYGPIWGREPQSDDDELHVQTSIDDIPTVAQLRGRFARALKEGSISQPEIEQIVADAGGDFAFPKEWSADVRSHLGEALNDRIIRSGGRNA